MQEEFTKNIESDWQGIDRLFSVFNNKSKEQSFRQEMLPRYRRLVFKLGAILAVAIPLFMLSDYMIVKPEPWASFLMAQRLVQITACLVLLFFIPKVKRYQSYDVLVFSTLLSFFILLQLGSFTFSDNYALYALFDIIIMISLYASGILPLKLSLILCGYHTLVAIFIVILVKEVSLHNQIVLILAYSFSNGAGVLLAMSQHRTSRQEFLLKYSLQERTLELKQMAYRDSLTNAHNRRAFQEHFSDYQRMAQRAQGDGKGLFLIAADIDHFKFVNDSFGHDVGDKVLVAFTALVESQIRPQDKIYRFGGEEFTIVMLDCEKDVAIQRIEQIMRFLNANGLKIAELQQPVTCSFGITPILVNDTVDRVCVRADEGLYAAKNGGRNRYVFDSGVDTRPDKAI